MIGFLCLVAAVTDADTIRCADGTRVRLAAINAREKEGSCLRTGPCPPMRDAQARPIVEDMALGRVLTCRPLGMSYRRVVADCRLPNGRNMSCAIVAAGAAAWWESYARRYRLRGCL